MTVVVVLHAAAVVGDVGCDCVVAADVLVVDVACGHVVVDCLIVYEFVLVFAFATVWWTMRALMLSRMKIWTHYADAVHDVAVVVAATWDDDYEDDDYDGDRVTVVVIVLVVAAAAIVTLVVDDIHVHAQNVVDVAGVVAAAGCLHYVYA